ncbi:MAG: 5-oxoprolinase subunit PxpB [Bacteroidota bacterium]|nr:5-oxoprolinase subunit PxpB [Bacteroidota bacterium]
MIKAGDVISEEVNLTVRKLLARIEKENIEGIIDFIPSYNELMVCYDPAKIGYRRLLESLRACAADLWAIHLPPAEVIHVPVLYGGEAGPDLQHVAEYNGLAARDVIGIHSSVDCLVYMLGFTPGFCYLGGMDKRIATPRQETPRLKIPAGSVGIAGEQTGIYPLESPGGWQLIGRTPLRLFNPDSKPEFLFSAGDYIRFYPVDKDEYERIAEEVAAGTYPVRRIPEE